MRVVRPARLGIKRVGGRRDHADLGIVLAPVGMAVAEDVGLGGGALGGGRGLLAHVRFRAMAAGSSGPERNREMPSIAPWITSWGTGSRCCACAPPDLKRPKRNRYARIISRTRREAHAPSRQRRLSTAVRNQFDSDPLSLTLSLSDSFGCDAAASGAPGSGRSSPESAVDAGGATGAGAVAAGAETCPGGGALRASSSS